MFKRFFTYFSPYKRLFFFDMICAFLIAGADLYLPFITKNYINDYIPNSNYKLMITTSVILLIIYIIKAISYFVTGYWGHLLGTYIEHDLRRDVYKSIQKQSYAFFDKRKTGDLMGRLTNDLRDIAEFAHHGPEDIFISVIMIIGSLYILSTFSILLTLYLSIFIAIMLLITLKLRITVRKGFRDVRKSHAEINSVIENSISGARLTKSFSNEDYEIDKFSRYNLSYKNSWKTVYFNLGRFMTVNNFLLDLLYLFVLSIGGTVFVAKGLIDTGEFVAFLLYLGFLMQPIKRLVNFAQMFFSSSAGLERVFAILDTKLDINNEGAILLENVKGDISFDNVAFEFNRNDGLILDGISFNLSSGKSLAIIGESGAGKTTISNIIPRFYDIQSGSIKIDGVDIRDYDLYSLRDNIGIVQQDIFIFYGTILENISYGNPEASNEEILAAAKSAEIHEFVMSLENGYDTILGERGITLSGGQKQRIGIARIFLKNPPILILDEATSALDTVTEKRIQSTFDKLAKDRTTIIIAHRLSTIRNADEIIVLENGIIKEHGSHEELSNNSIIYKRIYDAS